ncbi:putative bifunctional diguanylate cyclase/phosphodiesterase [Yoonia sp. 2307UL14-13]|uniref:putative bifunctional diguanylate cyclase/phosphodiesterase n=1 Tax=Yoonia sp. 2307UL14-13 TaxID=3126506 RepID=UPI00309811EC
MLRIVACLTQEHDYRLVVLAALICVTGAILTVRLFMRARHATRTAGRLQIGLTSIVGGGMIWATHFVAMLAYDPAVAHGYAPVLTALSLVVGILGVLAALIIATFHSHKYWMELGGAVFGLTVAAMHYVGMSAYLIPGRIMWDPALTGASIFLGIAFGALSFNRIGRPVTRYCWLGSAVAMVLAICMMHFVGMSAISIMLDPTIVVPPNPLSDNTLAALVLAAIVLILVMGLSAFMIESRLTEEARFRLQRMSVTDTLTGLPNRIALQDEVDRIAAAIPHRHGQIGVISVDLDMFKYVNDMYGPLTGDAVLEIIGGRLRDLCGDAVFVARSGGDEFVIIDKRCQTSEALMAFAGRIRDTITTPVQHNDLCLTLGASIGISAVPAGSGQITKVLEQSDAAMSHAKRAGRDQICWFQAHMHDEDRARTAIRLGLRNALAHDQFELHYQRQNDIASEGVVGFEALIRWRHPEKGLIGPGAFIPVAEETGMICDIGRWVLRRACKDAATWPHPYRVAVNVAPQQLLRAGFVADVADVLRDTGLCPTRVELEITEASIIGDHHRTLAVMRDIKALGVRMAMDDFGTGYSSLATLQAFPFDKIKIDRSFVTDVYRDETRAVIVRATLMIAETMKIPVLAEGVENMEELAFLRSLNCQEVQGFYFGKPLSPPEMNMTLAMPAHRVGLAS